MQHKNLNFLSSNSLFQVSAVLSLIIFYFKTSYSFQINSYTIYPTHIFILWFFFLLIFHIVLRFNEFEKKSLVLFLSLVGYIVVRLFFENYSSVGFKDALRLIFYITLCLFLMLGYNSNEQRSNNIVVSLVYFFLIIHLFYVLFNSLFSYQFTFEIFWGNYKAKQFLGLTFLFLLPIFLKLQKESFYQSKNLYHIILGLAIFFVLISFDRKAILSLFIFFLLISYKKKNIQNAIISIIILSYIILLFQGIIHDQYAQRTFHELNNLFSLGSGRLLIYKAIWENLKQFTLIEFLFGRGIGADINLSKEVWNLQLNSHLGISYIFYNYGILFLLGFSFFTYFVIRENKQSITIFSTLITIIISQLYSISILYSIYLPLLVLLKYVNNSSKLDLNDEK